MQFAAIRGGVKFSISFDVPGSNARTPVARADDARADSPSSEHFKDRETKNR
jgi:hypothetical protein